MITKRETPQAISRTEAKTRLVVRVKMCVSSGDYARAAELLRGAAADFPNDAELSELQKLANAGVKRKIDADRLITESQELFAQQKSAKAIQLLRQAYDLDKSNSLACSILANALVEHAQSIVENDWWEAETLANEALALNPVHPTAKKIFNLILDQKTSSSVEVWVSQTRKLHTSGNLTAALSQIAEGFSVYPREPRLLQMQDAIQREHSAQRRQARRRDLEDLRRSESEIDAVADVASKIALAERIEAVAAKHSTDGEILSIANRLLQRLGSLDVPQKSANPSRDSKGTTHATPASSTPKAAPTAGEPTLSPVSPGPALPSPILPSQALPDPVSPSPVSQGPAPSDPASPSQIPQNPIPPANAASGDVAPSKAPGKIAPSKVPLRTAPRVIAPPVLVPRATARPDIVASSAPEPRPASAQTTATPAAEPAAAASQVTSPSSDPKHPTESNSRTSTSATSNSTTLILAAAAVIILVAAIFFFAGRHYAPSAAKTPAAAPTVPAPAVSTSSAAASAVSTSAISTPAHTTPEPSLPASRSSSDTVAGEATPISQSPSDVHSNNMGALLIVADQDNAKVFLNGKLQRQLTQAGRLHLPNLEPKDYVVQVSKSGFQDPPQQRVSIRKSEQAKLSFNLQPNPQPQARLASLTVQGGTAGTSVLIDQAVVGTIQPDGTLSVSTVNPGDHTVELRKEQFKPRQFKKHFVVGGAISLVAADAALEAASSELKITYAPADAKVVVAKTGVLPTMVLSGVPLNLAAGTYTLTARNADGFTRYSTIEVVGGQSKALDLSLAPNGMSKWEDASGWKHEGDSFVRKGGDFVLYGAAPASGTFILSAMVTKGHLLQWVADYVDPKNYVLFQMDENNFHRAVIHNGVKTDEIAVPDKGDKKAFHALRIRISPTEIVHQIKHGDRWTALDRWTQPGVNLGTGKFGFFIPGNDEVALTGFAHYVDLNIH